LMSWSWEFLLRLKQLHRKCWRDTEYRLDILRATNGGHVEVF
jgi:hypothetical protein